MVKGKHLGLVAAVIGLLISASPSDASLILESVAASVNIGLPGTTTDFGSRTVGLGGTAPQFQQSETEGIYEADFDFPIDGEVQLTLRYLPVSPPTGGFDTSLWTFTLFNWGMPGRISGVDNPNGATIVTEQDDLLQIRLPATTVNEGQRSWEFTIHSAAPAGTAPEPGTLLLLGMGVAGLARMRRRR